MEKIITVSFSPTGQTERTVRALGAKIGEMLQLPVEHDRFTLPAERTHVRQYDRNSLVVFGTPTYAGRVPNKALPFIQQLFQGNKTPAVAVVTFGNRAFDSSLTELRNELASHGFTVIGAGAFAMPHAFARIGTEHPDADDLRQLDQLAAKTADKIRQGAPFDAVQIGSESPVGPYYIPRGTDGLPAKFLKAKPKTDPVKCSRCGLCAWVCPMGSIDVKNTDDVPGICIKCQACIQNCPAGAKFFDDPRFLSHKQMLEENYQRRAQSEIFF